MKRRTQVVVTVGVAAAVSFGLCTGAHALWSVDDAVVIPPVRAGAVTFAAQASDGTGTRLPSAAGEPVTVTLPGAEIARVLDQTGVDPDPVVWRFRASGAALGVTGLSYGVSPTTQVHADGTTHDVSSGVARENTVLAGSTITIFPAALGGDCSIVPSVPPAAAGEPERNIHVVADPSHVLQAPGTNLPGREIVQEWCVAMRWNHDPDGEYVNDAQVTATGEDGTDNGAMARWRAAVAFPPALDPLGTYVNRGSVEALGEDLTMSRDHDDWYALLYPDPSGEPDLTIALDPVVTHVRPDVAPDDTGASPAPTP
jgi:hypothetical protein